MLTRRILVVGAAVLLAASMGSTVLAIPSGPAQNGCHRMLDAQDRLEEMGKPTSGIQHGIDAICVK